MDSQEIPASDWLRCITLNGMCRDEPSEWIRWMDFVTGWMKCIDCRPTHFGITADGWKSKGILKIIRQHGKILRTIESGASIKTLEYFSLPDRFAQALFAFHAYISKDKHHVYVWVEREKLHLSNLPALLEQLESFCNVESREIFDIWRYQHPLMVINRSVPWSKLSTLHWIEGGPDDV